MVTTQKTSRKPQDFRDKVVLVTGASGGIGRAVASAFASRGARVAVHFHRNRDGASGTANLLPPIRRGPGGGTGHEMFQADLTRAEEVRELVRSVVARMGRLDILINNAAIFVPHPPLETKEEEWIDAWNRTLQTNLIGPAMLCFHAARQMAEHGGGRIVCVSSRGAFRGEPTAPAYGASKAALNAMSQSLAVALAPHNVTVAVVAPGFVETERILRNSSPSRLEEIRQQIPRGQMAHPEEIAETVVFLASAAAPAVTGTIVDANGASYLRS